jgi:hypothetical protein
VRDKSYQLVVVSGNCRDSAAVASQL